ncbi:MAG: hypothetical protein BMS9Abin05_2340 [Rhodothermia bacterium]|nr:MAG: hypothetical protein BMS9Abin05_2340 [Rhodothermia bacterium]
MIPHASRRATLIILLSFLLAGFDLSDAPFIKTDIGASEGISVVVTIDRALHPKPIDGRVLLMFSKRETPEPRFQVVSGVDAIPIYGVDIDQLEPGQSITFDGSVFGYPFESLNDLAPGSYYVQALVHKYETFDLSTGHTVKLPMNRGAGQNWRLAPGNVFSAPVQIEITGESDQVIRLSIDNENPPISAPEDTRYVRHLRMRSDLLSEFWGRDIFVGAHVLVPEGFDEHPDARYPLMVFQGHYPADFSGFRTEPPDPDLEPDYSERFGIEGYNRIRQQEAYAFYQQWISDDFPRYLVAVIQHSNPYYDDSYAVNSASIGPYGDALTYELIPEIEERFRGIGEGWARFTYGGSTGGWEAMAVQVFYPEEYNGAFIACPDPIDFREYVQVNIYEDDNAYYYPSDFRMMERPSHRDWLGQIQSTIRDDNLLELALGTNGRSGQQWDIWQAVYSPMGPEGYPKPIWDKYSGEIDREVAEYWKENYDLRYILERDWETLGPKVAGKLHIYAGDMDNYYLNNAVYLAEEFLESTTNPYYGGIVDYGDRAEHCWNGDQDNPNAISRLRYNTRYLPLILDRIEKTAPPGADLTSWRY